MSRIVAQSLTKEFRSRPPVRAIDDVSFEVEDGDLLVLLGPSGCGKTTTLRCLAGLEKPDSGEIDFGGKQVFSGTRGVNVPSHRRDLGLVFQTFALWPHLTARSNIEFPLQSRRVRKSDRRAPVEEVAKLVELDSALLDKRPGQLSGGQQQRVALARALAARPSVVLFDEPLSNLDALLREQLRIEVRLLHRRIGFTGVYVTHDLSEALVLGDQIAVMQAGQVAQVGKPLDVFNQPCSSDVARLLGFRRVCTLEQNDGRWTAADCELTGALPNRASSPGQVDLLVRPEAVSIRPVGYAPKPDEIVVDRIRIDEVAHLGSQVDSIVSIGDRRLRLVSHEPLDRQLRQGEVGLLCLSTDQARFYDNNSGQLVAHAGSPPAHEPIKLASLG